MLLLERTRTYATRQPAFKLILDALDKVLIDFPEDKDDMAEVLLQRRQNTQIVIRTSNPAIQLLESLEVAFLAEIKDIPPLKYLVFVYGTLKRGFRLHGYLAQEKFINTISTQPQYKLYVPRQSWFPLLIEDEKNGSSIEGELWEVSEETLTRLDHIEGRLFCREFAKLHTPYDEELVELYLYKYVILPEDIENGAFIDCGTSWQGIENNTPEERRIID